MPTKTAAKQTPDPFPYFGAGEAYHFAFAGLELRFVKKPTPVAMKKIIALAPALIRPAARNFKGRMLAVRSGQYVNAAILREYGLNGDKAFIARFVKLVSKCDDKLRAVEMLSGRCNGLAVGYGPNEPDRKMAAGIAKIVLKIPLTRAEKAECEFLDRLRAIARG